MSSIAAKQVHRQESLQPRLALPAGRSVSFAEGRRLAKLVEDEDERLYSEATQLLDAKGAASVSLEESVSKKILLLRQKGNAKANVKAAVAYANRMKQRNLIQKEDGERMRDIANKVMRHSSHDESELKNRRNRAANGHKKMKKQAKKN